MSKLLPEQLKENLGIHLSELESLQSMFCMPGELKIEDICTLADIKEYVDDKTTIPPPCLDFVVNVAVDNLKFELCVTLPHGYPMSDPELYVRNSKLKKTQHQQINKDLTEFIGSQEKGEPRIYSAVYWLIDNAINYVQEDEEILPKKIPTEEKYFRYWIYSHHIYSKTKRKEIADLANQLKITGFCMPGKPGIMCVEGLSSDVVDWWQSTKSMSWKKIFCKVTEEDQDGEGRSFLKFDKFEEVVFQNSGIKYNHMDMGGLYRYLEEHSVGHVFKELFGVEARSSTS